VYDLISHKRSVRRRRDAYSEIASQARSALTRFTHFGGQDMLGCPPYTKQVWLPSVHEAGLAALRTRSRFGCPPYTKQVLLNHCRAQVQQDKAGTAPLRCR
jgi:hypothetical protein